MNWGISFIFPKSDDARNRVLEYLSTEYSLLEGSNINTVFGAREVNIFQLDNNSENFDEICVGFPKQKFHKERWPEELLEFTTFVSNCFMGVKSIQFAVCSYELNGYIHGHKKDINDFDDAFLEKFPVVYKRGTTSSSIVILTNMNAQDIF
jgi:hypothetical protein